MLPIYPIKFLCCGLAVGWLLRRFGLRAPTLRLVTAVTAATCAVAVGGWALSLVDGGVWAGFLALGFLGALAAASHCAFADQRTKILGKGGFEASPKRRQGGQP